MCGSNLGCLSQIADFSRHNRKPSSHLAGPCRLDGCIDGQKICLVGNVQNTGRHAVDLGQFVQAFQRILHGNFCLFQPRLRIFERRIRALSHLYSTVHHGFTGFGTVFQTVNNLSD